jgi:MFS transporter, NNP family, nitrate/nitrite transporter
MQSIQKTAPLEKTEDHQRQMVLWMSLTGFTLMFAVWLMFGVLGIPIRKELNLSDSQFAWLTAVAILNGAIWRLFFGIITDRLGGRLVFSSLMLFTAIPTLLVSHATSYTQLLLLAFLLGMAGNAFSVGVSWVSAWFPQEQRGFALGLFGAGNVGASVTKIIGPTLIALVPGAMLGGLVPGGWRFVPTLYAVLLVLVALLILVLTPRRDRKPGTGRSFAQMLEPLRQVRVWRFSLYYVVVFGVYVALSAWLPKYYVDVFALELHQAALLTALFIFPASLLRPLGGYLSDRFGARGIMYVTFGLMLFASGLLMMPEGHIVLETASGRRDVLPWHVGVELFTVLVVCIGVAMGIGKAAVFKHIPEYFPNDVGAVGGLVGMLGALGGFFLPPLFALAQGWTGLPQATFAIVFVVSLLSLIWMHLTVVAMLNRASPHLEHRFEHPQEPA